MKNQQEKKTEEQEETKEKEEQDDTGAFAPEKLDIERILAQPTVIHKVSINMHIICT